MAQGVGQMQSINSNVHQIKFNQLISQQQPQKAQDPNAQQVNQTAQLGLPNAQPQQQTQQMQNPQFVA